MSVVFVTEEYSSCVTVVLATWPHGLATDEWKGVVLLAIAFVLASRLSPHSGPAIEDRRYYALPKQGGKGARWPGSKGGLLDLSHVHLWGLLLVPLSPHANLVDEKQQTFDCRIRIGR